jgi:hypothetical protein
MILPLGRAVEQIAETGDGDQDSKEVGDEARPVGQVGDEEQVKPEEDETGVPDIAEGVDSREGLGVCLSRPEGVEVVGAVEEAERLDELGDGDREDPRVNDPEARSEH